MNPANLDAALDAWITGSYGEEHPDNTEYEEAPCVYCGEPIDEDGDGHEDGCSHTEEE